MSKKARRSRTMRAVKSKNTGAELAVRRLVHGLGFRYRLHAADLPGKPDIVFRPRRKVIFVHGCFWHGHDCARGARKPKCNSDYWGAKIARNAARDMLNLAQLTNAGWNTLLIWECEIKNSSKLAERVSDFLRGATVDEPQNQRAEGNPVISERRKANVADDREERLHDQIRGDERGNKSDSDNTAIGKT